MITNVIQGRDAIIRISYDYGNATDSTVIYTSPRYFRVSYVSVNYDKLRAEAEAFEQALKNCQRMREYLATLPKPHLSRARIPPRSYHPRIGAPRLPCYRSPK